MWSFMTDAEVKRVAYLEEDMEQRLMEPIKSMGLTGVETATPPPSDDMPVSAPGQGLALQEEGEAEPKAKPTTRSTPRLPGVPAEPTPDLLRPQAQPRPKKAKTVPAQRRSRVVRGKQVGPPSRPTDATKGRVIRHVHVGGTRVTLSVPIKCPGCKRRVLSQEQLDYQAKIVKPGRRPTKKMDPMDARNMPHNKPTKQFYDDHVGKARMTVRDLMVYHAITPCTASRNRTSPHTGKTTSCCKVIDTVKVA